MLVLRVCVVAMVVAGAGRALAQPALPSASPLSVSRGPGTDDCPDAAGLLERIERIRKGPARAGQPGYTVELERDEAGIRARIVSAQGSASRELRDQAPDCAALAQAIAVTLALLFDADAEAHEETREAVPVEAAPVELAVAAVPDAGAERAALRSSVALGAGALLGVTRPVAPALVLELGVGNALVRGNLGALYAVPLAYDFASGSVREGLIAGALNGCIAPWSTPGLRFEACAGGVLGALHASARGFDQSAPVTRLWSALTLDLRLGLFTAPLGAELVASLLVPLRRQDFAIDNLGETYASSPVALLLAARAIASWP